MQPVDGHFYTKDEENVWTLSFSWVCSDAVRDVVDVNVDIVVVVVLAVVVLFLFDHDDGRTSLSSSSLSPGLSSSHCCP